MPLAVHFVAFLNDFNDLVAADPAGPLSLALDGAPMPGLVAGPHTGASRLRAKRNCP
jgi:hypothetical protein